MKARKKNSRGGSGRKREQSADSDLTKLKKKDLLEIMLKQGEEIDKLREKVADLEEKLENRNFELSQIGNIAEASLVVTKVFEEAQKAAVIYLENIRRIESKAKKSAESGSIPDDLADVIAAGISGASDEK